MEEYPSGVEVGEDRCLFSWVERWDEAEQEANGQDEDAERDGFIASVDEEEGESEDESEEGLGLVGVDREAMMGCIQGLDQRDELEEERGGGGGNGDVTPAGTVVQRCRKDGERGNTVEENRNSEPDEGHGFAMAGGDQPQTLSISCGGDGGLAVIGSGFGGTPLPYLSTQSLRSRGFRSGLKVDLG